MSTEFEKEPTGKVPFREMQGGGDLPVTTNFTYQPGATSEPTENTTSVTLDFELLPDGGGWRWQAWAANFTSAVPRESVEIPSDDRGFTSVAELAKESGASYFGVYVECTKGAETETQEIMVIDP